MIATTQKLGFLAQTLGMSQDALEKSLIDHLTKLDKSMQGVYTLLGNLSNSLAAAPGGAAQSGGTAAGLISPAAIAALPPLQTLDSELSGLLTKLEPGIQLLLQLRDAAKEAAGNTDILTASLAAMAVAARGVSNLMSGQRADGGPRRDPEDAIRIAVLAGSATQRSIVDATSVNESTSGSIYYVVPQNAPGSRSASPESTPDYSVRVPGNINYPSLLEEIYSRSQSSPLVDTTTVQILGYLARFEPILQGIDKKSVDCLKYLQIIYATGGGNASSLAEDVTLGLAVGITGGVIATLEAPVAIPIAACFLIAHIIIKALGPEVAAQRENMKYEYLNKFYVRPNPNRKESSPPESEFKDSRLEHPATATISAIDSIPPSAISNITNNYYDNTTNKNETYYGTLSRHELDQISFNKCLDKAMAELARDVESGMMTC